MFLTPTPSIAVRLLWAQSRFKSQPTSRTGIETPLFSTRSEIRGTSQPALGTHVRELRSLTWTAKMSARGRQRWMFNQIRGGVANATAWVPR